jgi:hypothetical protein
MVGKQGPKPKCGAHHIMTGNYRPGLACEERDAIALVQMGWKLPRGRQ